MLQQSRVKKKNSINLKSFFFFFFINVTFSALIYPPRCFKQTHHRKSEELHVWFVYNNHKNKGFAFQKDPI